MTYEIMRTAKGVFMYRAHPPMSGEQFRHFDNSVTDHASILKFFQEGRHAQKRGQYDPPELTFVDHNSKPVRHYKIVPTDTTWLKAVENYGQGYRYFQPADIWPDDQRLQFLRDENRLPSDIDDLPEAIAYLTARRPEAIQEYEAQLKLKAQSVVPELCKQHARKFHGASAIVEFQDTTGSEQ